MLPDVFELFKQGEWSLDSSQGGMGIGLALVRRLVELHGGRITAASPGLGGGNEFALQLPVLKADITTGADSFQKNARLPPMGKAPHRRILAVDDKVDAAKTLSILLSMEGHEVRATHDGPSALKFAGDFRPDVVLLDIGLPKMDGYEVARRLRKCSEMQSALLVALTGYGQDRDKRKSEEAGFNTHLVKPMELAALRDLLMCSALPASSSRD